MATDTTVVVAADSRLAIIDPDKIDPQPSFRDNDCKIRALNGNLVFAAAGFLTGPSMFLGRWDVRQIAVDLARSRTVNSASDIDNLAMEWAEALRHLQIFPSYQGIPEVQAVFAGIVGIPKRTHAANIWVMISGLAPINFKVFEPDKDSRAIHTYGSGYNSLMGYARDHGPVIPDTNEQPDEDRLVGTTYRVTALAIKESTDHTVGGEIDQVRLSAKGVEWIHRKPNCPAEQ
jgi:hypothetical protein